MEWEGRRVPESAQTPEQIFTPYKYLAGFPTQDLSASCPSSQKFKVIHRIQLLQQAANSYDLEPDERFGAWFQAMEPISVHER